MPDKKTARGLIIGVEPNGKSRAYGSEEFVGSLVAALYKVPETVERALADRDREFSREALGTVDSAKQANSLHYLLGFYPDESEDSGRGERFEILKAHEEKFGPLPYHVVYYLLRCALSGSYKKVSTKNGRSNSENHPNKKKKERFEAWAKEHIKQGATPRNITDIKRFKGFDMTWGVDDTIKRWWNGIENAPALKPGATRT